MKKLIFLLILAVIMVGFVPAQDVAYPPGALSLEAELSGYAAESRAVTLDTVPAVVLLLSELPAGFFGLPGYIADPARRTHSMVFTNKSLGYWLRL